MFVCNFQGAERGAGDASLFPDFFILLDALVLSSLNRPPVPGAYGKPHSPDCCSVSDPPAWPADCDFSCNLRGDKGIRTLDPLLAKQVLSQLSYTPFKSSGSHLLSHTVSSIVSSAVRVLTIVFGMGTGVTPGRIATANS